MPAIVPNNSVVAFGNKTLVVPINIFSLTYSIPALDIEIAEYWAENTAVHLKTPEELGVTIPNNLRFDGWMVNGSMVTDVVINGDVKADGVVMCTVTYNLPGATPETAVKTYPYGAIVPVNRPNDMGMTLPVGTFFWWWTYQSNIIGEFRIRSNIALYGVTSTGVDFNNDFNNDFRIQI